MRNAISSLAVLIVAISLAGCAEQEITGSFGSSAIAGNVVMSGSLAGESPAGVMVSVDGTGMMTVLGADGSFRFVGIPEESVLRFQRDGVISAELGVTGSDTGVIIELDRSSARKKRSRAVSRQDQYEGTIVSVGTDSLVLDDASRGEVTIVVTSQTVIRKGNQTFPFSALVPEMRIHVKGLMDGDDRVAIEIKIQDSDDDEQEEPEPRDPKSEHEGLIVSVSSSSLTVLDSHGMNVTFAITSDTVIRKGGTALTPDDLGKGDRVHVRARVEADSSRTAIEIKLQKKAR